MFNFGGARKPAVKKASPPPGGQKRGSFRASVEFTMLYTLGGRPGPRSAQGDDLSAGGLRLIGDEDLPNGSEVVFRFTLPNERISTLRIEKEIEESTSLGPRKKKIMVPPPAFKEMTIKGKVVITFLNVRRRKFMQGIQFLALDPRVGEEIQRFVHLAQLRELRDRSES
jgi:c-di-GMP-binding flagellar brake protein YcgR